MRQNHIGFDVKEELPELQPSLENDDTYVKWVTLERDNGKDKKCNPSIRFKCLMFL